MDKNEKKDLNIYYLFSVVNSKIIIGEYITVCIIIYKYMCTSLYAQVCLHSWTCMHMCIYNCTCCNIMHSQFAIKYLDWQRKKPMPVWFTSIIWNYITDKDVCGLASMDSNCFCPLWLAGFKSLKGKKIKFLWMRSHRTYIVGRTNICTSMCKHTYTQTL